MLLSELCPGDRLQLSKKTTHGIKRKIVTVINSCNRFITVDHGNYKGSVNLGEIKARSIMVKLLKGAG